MSCNNCNKNLNCGCNTQENCIQKDCSCPILDFPTSCLLYNGDDLECSLIETNQPFNDVIKQLDAYICERFTLLSNIFQIVNIGVGSELYKGTNSSGQKEIRTLTKTGDLILITQNENDVNITIDEAELETFVSENESTYSVENLEGGVGIYKDNTVVGNNTQFNLRSLKSNSLNITEDGDTISIEVGGQDLGGVRDFIVNTRYTGDEELGTEAKPFKNLDNAVLAYIGSGTRLNPEFESSRILCKGGQSHNFTENLSIAGLILEIEVGTTIRYIGADLYPIDFRTLQTAAGGYSNQSKGLFISIEGGGKIISDNLFAYIVSSGSLVTDVNRFTNLIKISGIEILSYYKENEFQTGITRSDLSPWVTNTREADFYFGGVEEAVIVVEGQSLTTAIADNNNTNHLVVENTRIVSLTQQVLELINGYARFINSNMTNNLFLDGKGKVIASNANLVGSVLTESPIGSYTLPDFKSNLCLAELNGTSRLFIEGGEITTGFEITENECWFKMNSDNCGLFISDVTNPNTTGGIRAYNFIETGAFQPIIRINRVIIDKALTDDGTLINTSVPSFSNAEISENRFNFLVSDNIDLTQNNSKSVSNSFKGKIKESLQRFLSRFQAINIGGLTQGDIFINERSISAGSFIIGEEYKIEVIGSTDFTLIGAASNTVGEYFTATGVGVGTGTASYNTRDIII